MRRHVTTSLVPSKQNCHYGGKVAVTERQSTIFSVVSTPATEGRRLSACPKESTTNQIEIGGTQRVDLGNQPRRLCIVGIDADVGVQTKSPERVARC